MQLKTQSQYIKEIKSALPKEAFAPASDKLLIISAYLLALFLLYFAFQLTEQTFVYVLLSLITGHCLASLGFLAHDLSHRAIIRRHKFRYLLEVLLFGVNLLPATFWDQLHNRTHHVHNNAVKKPLSEPSSPVKERPGKPNDLFMLRRRGLKKWNPLLRLHFLFYLLENYIVAIQAEQESIKETSAKGKLSGKKKWRIVLEIGVIMLIQLLIFFGTGAEWWAYFWAGPVAYLFTFSVLMAYIFTNHTIHSVNALHEVDDPLLTTISVEVHPVWNKLHLNFAYHTEHHLFPSLNSDYYPVISKMLKEKYPEKYNYLRLEDAWRALWEKYLEEVGK